MLGNLIDGRFTIGERVGEGGMGVVHRATDATTGNPVAFKVLRNPSTAVRLRFEREVEMLAALDHPDIVHYVAHGLLPSGEPYLAMEWVDGESLDQRLASRGIDLAETIAVAKTVASALAAAHAVGIVHRDLKPSNLLLQDGRIDRCRLIDFGIARRTSDVIRFTRTGEIVGSPGYLAPEQVIGAKNIGPAADVFALGCVLYECLTGHAAFAAAQLHATLSMVLVADPIPVVMLAPEVPIDVETLLDRMLEKNTADRIRDGSELVQELAKLGATSPDGPRRSRREENVLTQLSIEMPEVHANDFLVLVTNVDGAGALSGDDDPEATARLTHARTLGEKYFARVESLIDGSLLAMIEGSVTDAAKLALELHAMEPDAPMLLASAGPGEHLASVIDMNARALDRHALAGLFSADASSGVILLHDAVADLLEPAGFEIVATSTGRHLVASPAMLNER